MLSHLRSHPRSWTVIITTSFGLRFPCSKKVKRMWQISQLNNKRQQGNVCNFQGYIWVSCLVWNRNVIRMSTRRKLVAIVFSVDAVIPRKYIVNEQTTSGIRTWQEITVACKQANSYWSELVPRKARVLLRRTMMHKVDRLAAFVYKQTSLADSAEPCSCTDMHGCRRLADEITLYRK